MTSEFELQLLREIEELKKILDERRFDAWFASPIQIEHSLNCDRQTL